MRTDEAYTTMMKFEKTVNNYLSANFTEKSKHDFVFIDDPNLQWKGVDLSADNGVKIDCKIKNTHDLNSIFQWPSVEITIKDNSQQGWFIANDIVTDAYMFISVFSTANSYKEVTEQNITKLNVMLFSKKQLTKWIEQHVSLKQLMSDALQLDTYNDRKDYYNKDTGKKLFHLKYSSREHSVCLVIRRDIYLSLPATSEFEIYPDKIVRLSTHQ